MKMALFVITIAGAALVLVTGPSIGFQSRAPAAPHWVTMEFRSGGVVILDGHATSAKTDLAARLNELARRKPTPRIWLMPSKLSSYADVAIALALVQKAGLQINMTAYEKPN